METVSSPINISTTKVPSKEIPSLCICFEESRPEIIDWVSRRTPTDWKELFYALYLREVRGNTETLDAILNNTYELSSSFSPSTNEFLQAPWSCSIGSVKAPFTSPSVMFTSSSEPSIFHLETIN